MKFYVQLKVFATVDSQSILLAEKKLREKENEEDEHELEEKKIND